MTTNQQRISQRYLIYRFFSNLWFVSAIWLYFYRLFITDQQIGILDGMAFAIGLLVEVPSGALADKYGRDKVVRLGQILAGSGFLLQAVSSNFVPIFVGQSIFVIGMSLVSGADEALFFDKLNFDRQSTDWRKLMNRGSQVSLIAMLIATIAGGWLHSINPRLPWILNGFALITSAVLIWSVTDDRIKKTRQKIIPELKSYFIDIKSGFSQFLLPKFRFYIPFIIAVQGLFYTTDTGLLRLVLLDRFHFDPLWGSIAIASSSLFTVGLLALMHKNDTKLSERKVLTAIGLAAASSLLLSIADIGMWGYFVIFGLNAGQYIVEPFMSEVINKQTNEEQRATVLSVSTFLQSIPYILLAPVIGYLNTNGRLEIFFITWAVFIFISVGLYLFAKKVDTAISLHD